MKKYLFVLAIICAISSVETLSAQDYKMAIGLRLSNSSPTLNNSVTGKYFLNPESAIEGILSFGSRFALGALYEKHKGINVPGLRYFYGVGAYVGIDGGRGYVGPTGILGLDYKFEGLPLNLSLDWKPELDIIPRIAFIPDAFGLSARFTLNQF
ncbi:MAG: hypothetical protein ABI151_00440 [Chitinophagaceae bacterium]